MISQTEKFLQFAISTDNVNDPSQHPCLQALPLIFLKAIKGIAGQVDAFLGSYFIWVLYAIIHVSNHFYTFLA